MIEATQQPRRMSVAVKVGGVTVGGGAPVVVQSMTNTDTADVAGTTAQVAALAAQGLSHRHGIAGTTAVVVIRRQKHCRCRFRLLL